ncbi:tetraspanin-18-like [Styela clava]|uniref:tetraspanin-18-like n=1 Tax=Styela clava TaxID=7725 RepID=UPI00193A09C1|nr:tetraspanin-18-like [Styela clava]
MESGGMTCIKYLMFFFNLLIFLAGAALLGVGIWAAVSGETFKQVVSNDPLIFNSIYIIIAVGAALFLIGFLGCCGAVNENRCLLATFFALVLILFIIQIVGAVLAIVLRTQAEQAARETMRTNNTDWDAFQQAFTCCGIDGPDDWSPNPPVSCCPEDKACTPDKIFTTGCKETIAAMFWVVAGIALGILVIELLAMIFSCCMYRSIGESEGFA